jgi:hypothetical protein
MPEKRERLTREVKDVYASLAAQESQQHFAQTTDKISAEAYYEGLLGLVLGEIAEGTFDNFQSGRAIMDAVAKDKSKWLSGWNGPLPPS